MKNFGARIKKLRENKDLTLKELSEKSGVQIATLSRIENEKMTGTLESHMSIARALDIDLPFLYQDLEEYASLAETAQQQPKVDMFAYNDRVACEILCSRITSKRMLPLLIRLSPSGMTHPEMAPAGSEKFVFVLEGLIIVTIGEQEYSLVAQQSLYFDATQPHSFYNPEKTDAKALVIVTPVS